MHKLSAYYSTYYVAVGADPCHEQLDAAALGDLALVLVALLDKVRALPSRRCTFSGLMSMCCGYSRVRGQGGTA